MKILSRFFSRTAGFIDKGTTWLLFLLLLVMTMITFAQVVTRYVFNFSITWPGEAFPSWSASSPSRLPPCRFPWG